MEKRIRAYRKYIDELLLREDVDWEQVREEHLIQLRFFQHERLIHLIVTVLFALFTFLCVAMISWQAEQEVGDMGRWFLVLASFMILLIPYVRHYYILENEVQKMYKQYDEIIAKMGKMGFTL